MKRFYCEKCKRLRRSQKDRRTEGRTVVNKTFVFKDAFGKTTEVKGHISLPNGLCFRHDGGKR